MGTIDTNTDTSIRHCEIPYVNLKTTPGMLEQRLEGRSMSPLEVGMWPRLQVSVGYFPLRRP
ncbi:hypothetical protein BDV93DRAFT_527848 [Ceratobasidium sp. AG-I]|nr:hypothetical protein BDV93DRAFT_527848 [Ceratobasidium sp. AG-I]